MQAGLFVESHMTLRNKITLGFVLWIVCEFAVFVWVAQETGLGTAILLGLLTSLIGGSLLKRAGLSALARLRQEASQNGGALFQGTLAIDETLAAIGALLLLIPGFITDALGILLALSAPRVWFAGWLAARTGAPKQASRPNYPPHHGPATIDLDPGDYHKIDEPRRDI